MPFGLSEREWEALQRLARETALRETPAVEPKREHTWKPRARMVEMSYLVKRLQSPYPDEERRDWIAEQMQQWQARRAK